MGAIANPTAVTLKNVLVATDLSPVSMRTLPYAESIARQYGSKIYLGSVIPLTMYGIGAGASFEVAEKECHDFAQEKLDRFSAAVRAQGLAVQVLLAEGEIDTVIEEWIKTYDVDLLALGTAGRTGLGKLLFGSIAEELVREAACPVLATGPALSREASTHYRTILYATDFSAASNKAAAYACSIACQYGARLILLHVSEDAKHESKRSLMRRLTELIPEEKHLPSEPEKLIAEGHPAHKILEIAKEHCADLIAIGARGSGFVWGASHFGSTAHEVIVSSPCPVLITRLESANHN
jgi:nucleotide-binding universal stress UspA family protein